METDHYLPLSGLQHLLFCERQCALIHVEGEWEENPLTLLGRELHERTDLPGIESRPGIRIARGVWLRSDRLRLKLSLIAVDEIFGRKLLRRIALVPEQIEDGVIVLAVREPPQHGHEMVVRVQPNSCSRGRIITDGVARIPAAASSTRKVMPTTIHT